MKEFLFSIEFPNFMVHLYQFEPLGKNESAQNMVINIKTFLKENLQSIHDNLYPMYEK